MKGLTSTHRTSRGDTPSAPTSRYLLTPTHTNTDTTHKKIFSWCLYPLPPCIYTLKGISRRDVIFVSLSRPLSFLVISLPRRPRPPAGPSIHASLEYVHIPSLGPAKYVNYTFTHVTSYQNIKRIPNSHDY